MTEKSQQITFTKGITNQPSDAICSDGELSNCVGLTAEYGELKPIQMPVVISGTPQGSNILCVHDGRYLYQDGQYIKYVPYTGQTNTVASFKGTFKDITTIGNSVIISTTQEMHYVLWTGNKYHDLGTRIPEPNVSFYMAGLHEEFVEVDTTIHDDIPVWTDEVVGCYNRLLKKIHQNKTFAEPFVARVGVELYDGSYTMLSNPFIMLPYYSPKLVVSLKIPSLPPPDDLRFRMYMRGYSLYVEGEGYNYSDWSDIVKSVCVFVSREIQLFNVESEAKWNNLGQGQHVLGRRLIGHQVVQQGDWQTGGVDVQTYEVLDAVPDGDIEQMLRDESVFFKLCDMGLSWAGGAKNTSSLFAYNVLDNIEAQQLLPNDDYHSHDTYCGSQIYSYNGRLHVSDAKRYFFGGFKHFFPLYAENSIEYHIEVDLRINGVDKTVSQSITTSEAIGLTYFYYPDPRAKVARIYNGNGNNLLYTRQLTEHPGLNGAYWFGGLPTISSGYAPYISPSTGAWIEEVASEDLSDTIMVSEADNPFLFLAKGYVKVNAPVVGMAAVTMALSEYQHGHQPLVVFTKKGIWSLTLNSEGYYIATQSESREVCNNASSITQVDHGIYFVSQKGLMYLNTAGVKCVSDQMRGTEFDEFIDDCMIAYDYRDSLLHIYPNPNNAQGFGDTYVYNMKTGTFSTVQGSFTNVVNNYPDTLVQNSSYYAYSFMQRPDEQSDGSYSGGTFVFNTYNARIETRPMKLENALALKSILQVRHIHTIKLSQTTTLKFKVYASNNLDRAQNTWVQLTSLRGRPWKYYKFVYEFTGLKATDRFAGTMLITQERRTDKLR